MAVHGAEGGLLRICTAGSVDDGKSTLIGRLLHDSKSVYEDQIVSVEKASKHRNAGPIDFSLFTDGLKAEREQGITIDVAYRYFATSRRKFILADTPGHEQYTRNMATGASTADVAILLIDARNGVRTQSKRHARIARLLGIKDFVLAINKMDLVDFDQEVYEKILDDFSQFLTGAAVHAIPMSALEGDNVTTRSERTPYFDGPPLLEFLETVQVHRDMTALPFRFPVQMCLRPNHDFRGFAGQIQSGIVHVGDKITSWPSGNSATVTRIVTFDGDLANGVRADVRHPDAGPRDRLEPRGRVHDGAGLRRAEIRSRSGVDGRAPARSGSRLPAQTGHAHGHGRNQPPADAEPDWQRGGLDRAAAGVRSLHGEPRALAVSS